MLIHLPFTGWEQLLSKAPHFPHLLQIADLFPPLSLSSTLSEFCNHEGVCSQLSFILLIISWVRRCLKSTLSKAGVSHPYLHQESWMKRIWAVSDKAGELQIRSLESLALPLNSQSRSKPLISLSVLLPSLEKIEGVTYINNLILMVTLYK